MKVYVSTFGALHEERGFHADVPLEDFVAHVLDSYSKSDSMKLGPHKWIDTEDGHFRAPEGLYRALIPEAQRLLKDCQPMIEVLEYDTNWLIIHWIWLTNIPERGEKTGWLFCWRDNEEKPYGLLVIHPSCSIDRVNGSITVDYQHQKLVFPAFEYPWPWPLIDPIKYVVHGKLNALLEPADDNPLTILLRSPRPYKGIGAQLVGRLQAIRDLLSSQA